MTLHFKSENGQHLVERAFTLYQDFQPEMEKWDDYLWVSQAE